MFLLTLATLKAISNFGTGLKNHCKITFNYILLRIILYYILLYRLRIVLRPFFLFSQTILVVYINIISNFVTSYIPYIVIVFLVVGSNTSSNILSMGFPGELVRSLFNSSISKGRESMLNIPDIGENGVVIHNPAIVKSTSDSSIDLNYIAQSLRKLSADTIGSDIESETIKLSNSNNNNKLQVELPLEFRSNSMPGRLPNTQRPSVIERISKEASNRFHNLYYRTISVESTGDFCGCCFWRKRESVNSFGVSIDVSDTTLSDILGDFYKDRSDSNESMEFHNPNFYQSYQQQPECSKTMSHESNLPSSSTNNNNTSISSKHIAGKYTKRASDFRPGVSNLVVDVIIEEIEEAAVNQLQSSPVELLCQKETKKKTKSSWKSPPLFKSKSETVVYDIRKPSSDSASFCSSNSNSRRKSSDFIERMAVLSDSQLEKKERPRRSKRRRSKSMSSIDLSRLQQLKGGESE